MQTSNIITQESTQCRQEWFFPSVPVRAMPSGSKRMSKFVDKSQCGHAEIKEEDFCLLRACCFRKFVPIFSFDSQTHGLGHRCGGMGWFVSGARLASLTDLGRCARLSSQYSTNAKKGKALVTEVCESTQVLSFIGKNWSAAVNKRIYLKLG